MDLDFIENSLPTNCRLFQTAGLFFLVYLFKFVSTTHVRCSLHQLTIVRVGGDFLQTNPFQSISNILIDIRSVRVLFFSRERISIKTNSNYLKIRKFILVNRCQIQTKSVIFILEYKSCVFRIVNQRFRFIKTRERERTRVTILFFSLNVLHICSIDH